MTFWKHGERRRWMCGVSACLADYLPEEAPDLTLAAFRQFFRAA
jgi:hypothetical protein